MTAVTGTVDYPMNRWFFEDAEGRYDIDLGDTFVHFGRLSDLDVPDDLALGYGSARGGRRLRELIAGLYRTDADRVLVTHGAQEGLALAYRTLLRPGDQVLAFRPGWQQTWQLPEQLGARVTTLPLDDRLDVDLAAVDRAADDRLRMVVLSSPGNPSGRSADADTLAGLVRLVERHDAYLVLDEEYAVDLSDSPSARHDRVLSVSGLSKVYGFPGLRTGWVHATAGLVDECLRHKFLSTIANSVLCEELACQVLTRREHFADLYATHTATGQAVLAAWAGRHADAVTLVEPQGTPFAWVRLRTGEAAIDFCRRVLAAGVLIVPGETVGSADGFRISFGRPRQTLAEGLDRIGRVLAQRDFTVNGVA